MTRPKALHDDLSAVGDAGVDTVISLLEPEEAALLGLEAQGEVCSVRGLRFHTYPIRDMSLPEPRAFCTFAEQIVADIRSGSHVAVHCRASIGRTGMLTCAVLGHFGYDADAAIAHVSTQRGTQIPDTQAQADFIRKIVTTPES